MKYSYLIIIFICMVSCKENKFTPRFAIVENGKIGFIDSNGKIVIKPQFHDAGDFSEGLANVRINGRYGYIDENGQFVIKPTYEYGTPFSEGLALVFNDGKSFFIDASGKKMFDCPFPDVSPFKNGRALVQTASKKYGVINKQGKLLIDTAYSNIEDFQDGLSIVHGLNKLHPGNAVIDSTGKVIFPYDRYRSIQGYSEGHFFVILHSKKDIVKFALVDNNGKVLFSRPYRNNESISPYFNCGRINAEGNRLNMIVQALNHKKEWKDIEYLPHSWCGNSYHKLQLNPNTFWMFATPVYEGEFKTRCRLALTYIDPENPKGTITIYSNEYPGSINPGQFWRIVKSYGFSNIMNPYTN